MISISVHLYMLVFSGDFLLSVVAIYLCNCWTNWELVFRHSEFTHYYIPLEAKQSCQVLLIFFSYPYLGVSVLYVSSMWSVLSSFCAFTIFHLILIVVNANRSFLFIFLIVLN